MLLGIVALVLTIAISLYYLRPTESEKELYEYMTLISDDIQRSLKTVVDNIPKIPPLNVDKLKINSPPNIRFNLPVTIDLSDKLKNLSCAIDLDKEVVTNKAREPSYRCPSGYWNIGGVCWGCKSGWHAKDKIICQKRTSYKAPCFPNILKQCTYHGTKTHALWTTLARKECPKGTSMWGGLCVPPCPSGYTRATVNLCVRK